MIIRRYREKDFDSLAEIHDGARKQELAFAHLSEAFIPFSIAAEREKLFAYNVYVAEISDKVVGFVAFCDDEIAWLYVDTASFRNGIGKKLVEFALNNTSENVTIEVLSGNSPALNLYSKCGFHIAETVSGVMPGNEAFSVTVHCMRK